MIKNTAEIDHLKDVNAKLVQALEFCLECATVQVPFSQVKIKAEQCVNGIKDALASAAKGE